MAGRPAMLTGSEALASSCLVACAAEGPQGQRLGGLPVGDVARCIARRMLSSNVASSVVSRLSSSSLWVMSASPFRVVAVINNIHRSHDRFGELTYT